MSDDVHLLTMTADIVSAYVGKNAARTSELPDLIAAVHASLAGIVAPQPAVEAAPAPTPAVPIKKSIADDYLICLDDGKKFKSLKRHLAQLGMTPDEYRAKWGLPRDYPMVAPGYAAKRSELAKLSGLGNNRRAAERADLLDTTALSPVPPEEATLAPVADPIEQEIEQEGAPEAESEAAPAEAEADTPAPKRRGRAKKAA